MSHTVSVSAHYLSCSRDRVTTTLMVICLAIPFAILLTVAAGAQTFYSRYQNPTTELMGEGVYLIYAGIAVVLTVVPTLSMSGAVARLGLSRRVRDLAVMRLLGVSSAEVKRASLIDTLRIAAVAMAVGTLIYLVTFPLWQFAQFQEAYLTVSQMWIGLPLFALCVVVTVVIVAFSAWIALKPLTISALGVARQQDRLGVSKIWALAIVVCLVAWFVLSKVVMGLGIAIAVSVGLVMLAIFFALVNLLGVLVISLGGRIMVALARRPSTLLAARRIMDNPRAQWRSYGGITLVAFIVATMVPVFSMLSVDTQTAADVAMFHDVYLGMMIVFAFTFALGAVSTLANQSARILDSAKQLQALIHLGAGTRDLDRARRWEVYIPMVLTVIAAFIAGLFFSAPVAIGAIRPAGIVPALGLLVAGVTIVALAGEATRWWQKQVLRG